MLTYLQIRDFAIIDSIELELRPGLTVLTGETGAGKSIMVDARRSSPAGALALRSSAPTPSGRRSRRRSICFAARASWKQWLEEQSIATEGELSVRRVMPQRMAARARHLNGQAGAGTGCCASCGNILIEIHGQHEFQSLTRECRPARAARRVRAPRVAASTRWGSHIACGMGCSRRCWILETKARDRDARLDMLRYQVGELEALQLTEGEFAELNEDARAARQSWPAR